jgi:TfoX/Sxy family transcriptional regulator of competence genes
MSPFAKAPPELVARFSELAALVPNAAVKPMFGYPSCQHRGYMFMGLFEQSLVLRLGSADLADFSTSYGARPFEPMPGRAMTGFVVVPAKVLADDPLVEEWIQRSYAFVDELPPKPVKAPRKKTLDHP